MGGGNVVVRGRRTVVCAVVAVGATVVGTLTGYDVPAGPFARGAPCAGVVAGLPGTLLGQGRDAVDGVGAAGWGGGAIVLRCGVRPLAPTVDTCVNVDGVDWVLDDERAGRSGVWAFTTYGREPAVEVAFTGGSRPAGDALIAVNNGVRGFPQNSKCLALSDT
ncbi:DUF3515 family protein [Streptomyces sp. AB3(2024)]|uniref:DUF3515 family protein n=1 Tax=Streptomyces sp. AB3(2024) TaxID=3317321 RepID=UPI0035A2A76D